MGYTLGSWMPPTYVSFSSSSSAVTTLSALLILNLPGSPGREKGELHHSPHNHSEYLQYGES